MALGSEEAAEHAVLFQYRPDRHRAPRQIPPHEQTQSQRVVSGAVTLSAEKQANVSSFRVEE